MIQKLKFLLPAASIFFILAGCKKDAATEPQGPISAKIDGTTKNFTASVKAIPVSSQSPYKIRIEGYDQPGSLNKMEITIVSPNPIVPGTYNNDTDPNTNVQIVYFVGNSLFGTRHDSWDQVVSLRRTGSVTISEISNSTVKGTFSCTLFYSTFTGTDYTKALTNGVFNVNF